MAFIRKPEEEQTAATNTAPMLGGGGASTAGDTGIFNASPNSRVAQSSTGAAYTPLKTAMPKIINSPAPPPTKIISGPGNPTPPTKIINQPGNPTPQPWNPPVTAPTPVAPPTTGDPWTPIAKLPMPPQRPEPPAEYGPAPIKPPPPAPPKYKPIDTDLSKDQKFRDAFGQSIWRNEPQMVRMRNPAQERINAIELATRQREFADIYGDENINAYLNSLRPVQKPFDPSAPAPRFNEMELNNWMWNQNYKTAAADDWTKNWRPDEQKNYQAGLDWDKNRLAKAQEWNIANQKPYDPTYGIPKPEGYDLYMNGGVPMGGRDNPAFNEYQRAVFAEQNRRHQEWLNTAGNSNNEAIYGKAPTFTYTGQEMPWEKPGYTPGWGEVGYQSPMQQPRIITPASNKIVPQFQNNIW